MATKMLMIKEGHGVDVEGHNPVLQMPLMRLTLVMTKMLMTLHEAIDTIHMTVMTVMVKMACHHQHEQSGHVRYHN